MTVVRTVLLCSLCTTFLAGCPAGTTGTDAATTDAGARVDASDGGHATADAGPTAPLCIAHGLCVASPTPAPPGFSQDNCWDGCNWCTCTATGAIDICTAQACDAGVPDAGVDAAIENDAGVDCATIGCGAPPICGTACDAPCGCCPCAEGDTMGSYVCSGGCWAPRGTGGSGDPCSATSDCGSGLSCCYPCGIPGCSNQCTPTCAPGTPGCAGGCPLVP